MTQPSSNVALATLLLAASNPARADDDPQGTLTIGAGFSTDESFIAEAQVAHPDLFGTGQGLSLTALISALRQDFVLAYDVPRLAPGLDLHAELYDHARNYPSHTRNALGGALELDHALSRSTRIYAQYRIERVQVDPAPADAVARTTMPPPELGTGTRSWLGAGVEHTTLDMPFLPMRGTHLALYTEASDDHIARIHGELDHARPLGPLTLRVHGHATLVHAAGGVPLSERLFHDGRADVLGYEIGAIGSPLGETAEAIGRVELELPLVPCAGLSLAGFANAGYRYNTDAAYGPVQGLLYRSVGASLIWRSPIGALRFDFARALDGERGWVFGFGLGGF